ncbi:hypothetical protein LSH36_1110g00033 [Paralvinella palmiformis]|uniref:Peptidoglycan recognition protein family domain-containing protein n=1 Tax=Paralvinella palmiformis TaxID=53620 RepID=A0AAD9IUU2_9ANNE|nr:hypothetical protein LSH36_1110g00033 [Paralvinella palmiformis]
MSNFKMLLYLAVIAGICIGQDNAFHISISISIRIRLNNQQIDGLCEGVTKAMIKREEWQAIQPRYIKRLNHVVNEVFVWHTGPDTCRMIGLSGSNCQQCIRDEPCMVKRISAIQNADLSAGREDIAYNFLIGQDGVIYEGRGWNVAGPEDSDQNTLSVGMIGDFTNKKPSYESLSALKNLLSCRQVSGVLSDPFDITTTPEISGKAFFDLLKRCNGICQN